MPRALPTLAILLLLVGQGLLATSGVWHRHGSSAGEQSGRVAAGQASCHHGHHHGEQPGRGDREPAPADQDHDHEHDDDCAVCLIVATQRMAVLADAQAVALAAETGTVRLPEAQTPGSPTRGPPRSRGPPPLNRA